MFFKIALTAATLALSAGAAAAIPGWTVTGLTIHQNAGAWYPVLGTVPPCTSVEVERYEGGWVRIGWQGQWGWVPHDYLRDSNSHCQAGYPGQSGYVAVPGYVPQQGHSGQTGVYQRPRY